jgi:phosphoglycolate phosphatase-like HAD superfamily hydrolase
LLLLRISMEASAVARLQPAASRPAQVETPAHALRTHAPDGLRLCLPRVLLCDLDGTLIDTMPILADLATDVLHEDYGMPRGLARDMYLSTSGLPFIRQLDTICPGDARNAAASARFEASKPARCNRARMTADTRRTLAELQRRGTRIVVSSNNGVENVAAFVATSGFDFDLVLGYDGRGLAKGRPHIERAASAFGVSRADMVFVGDSLHDGEIAEREALRFVGVAGTFSRERFQLRFPGRPIVDRLGDIAGLFT